MQRGSWRCGRDHLRAEWSYRLCSPACTVMIRALGWTWLMFVQTIGP